MTTQTAAEQQEEQQHYRDLARASVVHAREHIRRLVEANKKISDKDYPAQGEAIFSTEIAPPFFPRLEVKLLFDSSEKIKFDGNLWPIDPYTLGVGMGQADFLIPPDELNGVVAQVFAQCRAPNPAIGGGVFITWIRQSDGLGIGTFASSMAVTTVDTVKVGYGTFRKE